MLMGEGDKNLTALTQPSKEEIKLDWNHQAHKYLPHYSIMLFYAQCFSLFMSQRCIIALCAALLLVLCVFSIGRYLKNKYYCCTILLIFTYFTCYRKWPGDHLLIVVKIHFKSVFLLNCWALEMFNYSTLLIFCDDTKTKPCKTSCLPTFWINHTLSSLCLKPFVLCFYGPYPFLCQGAKGFSVSVSFFFFKTWNICSLDSREARLSSPRLHRLYCGGPFTIELFLFSCASQLPHCGALCRDSLLSVFTWALVCLCIKVCEYVCNENNIKKGIETEADWWNKQNASQGKVVTENKHA